MPRRPKIAGQFTNWKFQKMFEIREFCSMIDPDRNNIFNKLQKEEKIS